MSTPPFRLSPLEVTGRAGCMCDHGDVCSSFAPGHALHLIQARLASATLSGWVDAVVVDVDAAAGTIRLVSLEGTPIDVWNAGSAALEVAVGSPVSVHGQWDVLAIGTLRYNVARL